VGGLSGQAATLRRWLAERPFVVLDGGLATTLENHGHDLDDALWSARLLRDDPEAIREVHREFAAAGADCLVTASYQANVQALVAAGASTDEAARLLRLSVRLAAEVGDELLRPDGGPLVAASIGPYGAFLADGSEYVGDYGALGDEALAAFHRPRWEILSGCCDLFACETLPSRREAAVLLELLGRTPGLGAWFSFACRDGEHIADGTPLAECAALCAASEQVLAVGVNCAAPALIDSLIAAASRGAPELPIVVYPNSGETYVAAGRWWRGRAAPLALAAPGWWRAGARLIGGCCRTGPAEIRALRQALTAAAG
jgi:homocysteine S-methyltransferase